MNTLHNVGKQVSSFELYDQLDPITGIWLFVGEDRDEDLYKAGNETGTVLEVYCPYGDQTMANTLLSQLQGQVYAGFRAQNAVLSPTAELGDWVTVNGGTYMLAYRSINFGPGHMAEIAAPGESTQEHEYGWTSPETRKTTYNQARSMISKTNKEIQLAIYGEDGKGGLNGRLTTLNLSLSGIFGRVDGLEGNHTQFKADLDGIATEVHGADGKGGLSGQYTSIKQTVSSIATEVHGTDGKGGLAGQYTAIQQSVNDLSIKVVGVDGKETSVKLSDGKIDLSGMVTFSALSGEPGQTKINGGWIDTETLTVTNVVIKDGAITWKMLEEDISGSIGAAVKAASNAADSAKSAASALNSITYTYGGKTYIDESMIRAGSITAGDLQGGTISLLGADEVPRGTITLTQATTSKAAVEIRSTGAMRLKATDTYAALWLEAGGSGNSLAIQTVGNNGYHVISGCRFVPDETSPTENGDAWVGTSYRPWYGGYFKTLYLNGSPITSDRNKKHDIGYDLSRYDVLFDALRPATYRLNDEPDRICTGLIAQDVENAVYQSGLNERDFGAVVHNINEDGSESYYLKYTEFIALLIDQVQKLKTRVAKLEVRV